VGDAKFQKRCLERMNAVAGQGRTVIFVSHNMLAVQRLCSRLVWLDHGSVRAVDAVATMIGAYLQDGTSQMRERCWDKSNAPGNDAVSIAMVAAEALLGDKRDRLTVASGAVLTFEYWNHVDGANLNLSLHIYSSNDTLVLNAVPIYEPNWFGKPFPVGRFRCTCSLPAFFLNADIYRVELLVVRDQVAVVFVDDNVISFEIYDIAVDTAWHGQFPGVVRPKLAWTTERIA